MILDSGYWSAVVANDGAYDGRFFYAVKTTGIFCRPSCPSRTPQRENVEFFHTAQESLDAGYRPCKRCRPDLLAYEPVLEMAEKMKACLDHSFHERDRLAQELAKLGVTQHRMVEIFDKRYGLTPSEYADGMRMRMASELLENSELPILEVAMHVGFQSVSAFYDFFRKHAQMTPGEYRKLRFSPQTPIQQAYCAYDTALGKVGIGSDGGAVNHLRFEKLCPWDGEKVADAITDEAARQIEAYCAGKRRRFDLALRPAGSAFQKSVWTALQSIPYGETRSYRQVAQMIGRPMASRAVGMANNKNPILLMIPCHRVVGSDGGLVGYAGGLEVKKQLLELEKSVAQRRR